MANRLEPGSWEPQRRGRACDICFFKKIKCDRDEPCANCRSSSLQCNRLRPNKRASEVNRVDDGVPASASTSTSMCPPTRPTPPKSNPDVAPTDPVRPMVSHGRHKRARSSDSAKDQRREGTASEDAADDDTVAQSQAQTFLQTELQHHDGSMEISRLEILRAALRIVGPRPHQLQSRPMWPKLLNEADGDEPGHLGYPDVETIFGIVNGPERATGIMLTVDFGSLVSKSNMEMQAFALIDGTAPRQVETQFLVNVNFAAWHYLGCVNADSLSASMKAHMVSKRKTYARNMLAALTRLGALEQPSLTLLQSFLSGALFMLLVGHLDASWQLSTAASRVCVGLGSQGLAKLAANPNPDEAEQVRYNICLTYMLDKALSMSMNRAASLPDMDLNLFDMIVPTPSKPYTGLVAIYLDLTHVQDAITRLMRKRLDAPKRVEKVQSLQRMMWEIQARIQQVKSQPPHCHDSYLQGEWIGMEFAYYSVMTIVVRLHPCMGQDTSLQQQLLDYARRSLTAFSDMQKHLKQTTGDHDRHTFKVSLMWVLLFCPLSPFFVIFCHVVQSSDKEDYRLLDGATRGLDLIIDDNPAVRGIRNTFNRFLALCRPLLGQNMDHELLPSTGIARNNHDGGATTESTTQDTRNAFNVMTAYTQFDRQDTIPELLWPSWDGSNATLMAQLDDVEEHDAVTQMMTMQTSLDFLGSEPPNWPLNMEK